MTLVLHKIVSAVRTSDNIVSGVAKIAEYGELVTSKTLTVRQFKYLDGAMKINGKSVQTVASELSMGFSSVLKDVYEIDTIPKALELRSIEDVKLLPSYAVGENLRFSENTLKPPLLDKLDSEAKRVMSSRDIKDELTPAIVERNPVLKNIAEKMSGKKVKTLVGTVVTFGIGIAAFCIVVNDYRIRLTACNLYYYVNGQLRRCAIATCTCKKVACTKDCNYCDEAVLKRYLPADMLVDNCVGFTGSADCVKCPSENFNKTDIADDKTLAKQDNAEQSSFVRCQKPDFFDAMSDLFGTTSQDLLDIVHSSLSGVSWIIQKLPYIILAAVVFIIIIIIISIFTKFNPGRNSSSTVRNTQFEYTPDI